MLTCARLQVNAHDDEDPESPVARLNLQSVPNSPPPSFHSRSSSPTQRHQVDPDLADAFDDPDDDSDAEPDDRQRLVQQNSTPIDAAGLQPNQTPVAAGVASARRSSRVMGGGVGSDGVFANMSARPERNESEKEEQPPVRTQSHIGIDSQNHANTYLRRTNKLLPMRRHRTGKRPSSPLGSAALTRSMLMACLSDPSSPSFGTA